jgi:peptidoglycan/xylan/chitin deacetylase (PgdA/CDA1 family)
MAQHDVTFGGHGAEHRVLTRIGLAQVRDEVATSKDVLQARLGKAPLAFAYPNGGWNREVAGIVRDAGYRLAFTIEPGAVDCRDDCFNLPRVNIHEGMTRATPMFLARVTGLF